MRHSGALTLGIFMRRRRILVVDDEAMVLDSVRLTLSHFEYTVATADSGSEALLLLAENQFDLVITDRRMPQMTGDQLALEIKKRWPQLPVILLTGYPPEKKPAGVDCVLLKPYSTLELRNTIDRLTGNTPT